MQVGMLVKFKENTCQTGIFVDNKSNNKRKTESTPFLSTLISGTYHSNG